MTNTANRRGAPAAAPKTTAPTAPAKVAAPTAPKWTPDSTVTALVALLSDTEPLDNDKVVSLVRSLSTSQREKVTLGIVAKIATVPNATALLPIVATAPSGADPAALVLVKITADATALVALVSAAIKAGHALPAIAGTAPTANATEVAAALVALVDPDTAPNDTALAAASKGQREKGTRTKVNRDTTKCHGMTFVTPKGNVVKCDKKGQWIAPDGSIHKSPSSATCTADSLGEVNGWAVLKVASGDLKGRTASEVAAV